MCQKEIKTSMGKMKNKVLPVSVLVLFMLMCINACGISKSRDSADMVSELNNRIIEKYYHIQILPLYHFHELLIASDTAR